MRPTQVLINLAMLEKNIRVLMNLLPKKTEFMAIVKANAYGHGAVAVSQKAIDAGATWLGVALPEEGATLRENGINVPILVLGEIDVEQAETLVKYNLTQAIPSLYVGEILNKHAIKTNSKIDAHLKLDTGMGRIGFRDENELKFALPKLRSFSGLNINGAFTHLAVADEEEDGFTLNQLRTFDSMVDIINDFDFDLEYIHASNSAGIINYPSACYNLVRGGVSMYGYYPSKFIEHKTSIKLQPVLQWETRVVHLKTIDPGDSVSYGRTFIADKITKVATLPVGYADGYNRLLSNKGCVLIHGKKAPIIGRVCMDQVMVDVTSIPSVKLGDKVILIGQQGGECITANDIADICGTISYEILTSISDRVPRIYVQ